MKLAFDRITISDFKLVTGEPLVVDLVGYGPGLHFVRGRNRAEPHLHPNGAGKTTLWHALTWALYGRTANGLRGTDVRPWQGNSHATRVAVELTIDGARREIVRETNPGRLLFDDRVVGQEQIDRTLLPFELFTNSILFPQGQPLFFDLAPRHKLELFSGVLDLERWDRRSALAGTRTEALERELGQRQAELQSCHDQSAQLKPLIESAVREHDQWEVEQAKRAVTVKKTIRELETKLAVLQRERDAADLAYDSAATELKNLRRAATQIEDYIRATQAEIAGKEAEDAVRKPELVRLRNYSRELAGTRTCPTCGQAIKRDNLAAHLSELVQQIAALEHANPAGQLKLLKQQLQDQHAQMRDNRAHTSRFQAKADAANDAMIRLDPQLAEVKVRLQEEQRAQADYQHSFNPHAGQLKQLRQRRTALQDEIAELKGKLVGLGRRSERHRFWIKGFKEVRLYQVEGILHELELAANAILAEFGLADWQIRYIIERETQSGTVARELNVEIFSPYNRNPVRFESWSGGEGQRLRLIGSLALADVLLAHAGVDSDLLILDEPSRSLGESGIDDLIDALGERARSRRAQIFFTEHRVLESARFTSTLTVTRNRNGVTLS